MNQFVVISDHFYSGFALWVGPFWVWAVWMFQRPRPVEPMRSKSFNPKLFTDFKLVWFAIYLTITIGRIVLEWNLFLISWPNWNRRVEDMIHQSPIVRHLKNDMMALLSKKNLLNAHESFTSWDLECWHGYHRIELCLTCSNKLRHKAQRTNPMSK